MNRRLFFQNIFKNALEFTNIHGESGCFHNHKYTFFACNRPKAPLLLINGEWPHNRLQPTCFTTFFHVVHTPTQLPEVTLFIQWLRSQHLALTEKCVLFSGCDINTSPQHISGLTAAIFLLNTPHPPAPATLPSLFLADATCPQAMAALQKLPNPLPVQHDVFVFTPPLVQHTHTPALQRMVQFVKEL